MQCLLQPQRRDIPACSSVNPAMHSLQEDEDVYCLISGANQKAHSASRSPQGGPPYCGSRDWRCHLLRTHLERLVRAPNFDSFPYICPTSSYQSPRAQFQVTPILPWPLSGSTSHSPTLPAVTRIPPSLVFAASLGSLLQRVIPLAPCPLCLTASSLPCFRDSRSPLFSLLLPVLLP